MVEKSIYLDGIDPINLYGANNVLLNRITSHFPKLRIVARGNEIIAIGDDNEIESFEEKITSLIAFFHKYNKLTLSDVDEILAAANSEWIYSKNENSDILVYGNHGREIKATSVNQQKLVENTDAVVALPGGTGTLEELLEILALKRLGKYLKPVVLLNTNNFYDPLIDFFNSMVDNMFLRPVHLDAYRVVNKPEDVIRAVLNSPEWHEDVISQAPV